MIVFIPLQKIGENNSSDDTKIEYHSYKSSDVDNDQDTSSNSNQENKPVYTKATLADVEEYLSSKYNMNLKISNYDKNDNENLGVVTGIRHTFTFEDIDGFELNAKLDHFELYKENLKYIILNITNTNKALELKNYVEERCLKNCKVNVCRKLPTSEDEDNTNNENDEYTFVILLDYNNNYIISGNFIGKIENTKKLSVSNDLRSDYNLTNIGNISFDELLKKINW